MMHTGTSAGQYPFERDASRLLEAGKVRELVEVRLKRDLDAAVERAALRGVVVCNRLRIAVGGR